MKLKFTDKQMRIMQRAMDNPDEWFPLEGQIRGTATSLSKRGLLSRREILKEGSICAVEAVLFKITKDGQRVMQRLMKPDVDIQQPVDPQIHDVKIPIRGHNFGYCPPSPSGR